MASAHVASLLLLAACASQSLADIYLHYPRGSNNRLNERSANRANANRLFDSQNNNRGGYNVAQLGAGQFAEKYFYGNRDAQLRIEWTMQHGCRDARQRCRVIIQAMCEPLDAAASGAGQPLRNGNSTQRQEYSPRVGDPTSETSGQYRARRAASLKSDRGLHEPFEWYDFCRSRRRNRGLFTADQRLRGEEAIYTRQNPNGGRSGYECPEERDYFPYWHPSPWLDVAVLTDDLGECPSLVRASQGRVGACAKPFADNAGLRRWTVKENNPNDCAKQGGQYLMFHNNYLEIDHGASSQAACEAKRHLWGVPHRHRLDSLQPVCLVPAPDIRCQLAPVTRDNHLGDGVGGGHPSFTWRLPDFPSKKGQRCVLRIRYNLTSHDPASLLRQRPLVNPGLRLEINTNQVGRVFQDRSHEFHLLPTPLPAADKLHHVGVRGKRGNIVQAYPSVEYDFVPSKLSARVGDHLLLQWSGADTHNNAQPAGDGQAGDDGAGAAGTDRNNWLEAANATVNYPLTWEASTFLRRGFGQVVWAWHGMHSLQPRDFAISLASAGHYRCFAAAQCGEQSVQTKTPPDANLNSSPASFPGIIIRLAKPGVFHFMSTRNNNFSNRSQKMTITVTS